MTIWAVIHEPCCRIESRSNRIERRLISLRSVSRLRLQKLGIGHAAIIPDCFPQLYSGLCGREAAIWTAPDKCGRNARRYCPAVLRPFVSLLSFSGKSDPLRRRRGFSLARMLEDARVVGRRIHDEHEERSRQISIKERNAPERSRRKFAMIHGILISSHK